MRGCVIAQPLYTAISKGAICSKRSLSPLLRELAHYTLLLIVNIKFIFKRIFPCKKKRTAILLFTLNKPHIPLSTAKQIFPFFYIYHRQPAVYLEHSHSKGGGGGGWWVYRAPPPKCMLKRANRIFE